MSYTLTDKGWEAALRPCGHPCVICDVAVASPEWRRYVSLVLRIADIDDSLDVDALDARQRSRLTEYRGRLEERRAEAWEALR